MLSARTSSSFAAAACLLFLWPAVPAQAAVLEDVEELSAESSYAKTPTIARDPEGDLWVAWTATVDGEDRIMMREQTAVGWSEPEQLDGGEGLESGAELVLASDGLWSFWHGKRSGRWSVYGRRLGETGWEDEIRLSLGSVDALHPTAAAALGRVWVMWEIAEPGGFSLGGRSIENGVMSESVMRHGSSGSIRRPRLVSCSERVYMAWDSSRLDYYEVALSRLAPDPDPTQDWTMKLVTAHPAIDDTPSLACSPEGDLWIAFNSTRGNDGAELATDRNSGDAFVRVLRDGEMLAPAGVAPGLLLGQVSHGLENKTPHLTVDPYWHWKRTQNYPRVFHDGKGAWVLWRTDATGAHDFQIFGRYHDGESWSEEINLTPFSPGRDEWPDAVVTGDGQLQLVWEGQLLANAERSARYGGGDVDAYNSKATPNVILTATLHAPPTGSAPGALEAVREPGAGPLLEIPKRQFPVAPLSDRKVFFGDPHMHSILSDAKTGWPDQLLNLSRRRLGLDFGVVSDHAEMGILQPSEFAELQLVARVLNRPGHFVSLSGWEWTESLGRAGHRVALFKDDGVRPLSADRPEGDTIEKLYDHLRGHDAVLSPHHTGNATWGRWNPDAFHDEELEPNFEIASWHGRFEYYGNPREGRRQVPGHQYQDALRRGRHVGVMAASDTHHLTPGEGGLTAILADTLDRESLFDALASRRNYATTGAKILLDFIANVGDQRVPMGSVVEARGPASFEVHVQGTAPIDRVEIVRDLEDTFAAIRIEQDPNSNEGIFLIYEPSDPQGGRREFVNDTRKLTFRVTDEAPSAETSYYLRVTQVDGHQAWSSPIWLQPASNLGLSGR